MGRQISSKDRLMKSLAHPSWPYEGTPHEWRGFAVAATPSDGAIYAAVSQRDMTPEERAELERYTWGTESVWAQIER